jgi:hypothetical protein
MSGHVFVVNGRIQHVVHNLAIVPTDSFLTVEEHWNAVYPLRRADPAVSSWAAEHFGQSQSCPTVWFLNVGGRVLGKSHLTRWRIASNPYFSPWSRPCLSRSTAASSR